MNGTPSSRSLGMADRAERHLSQRAPHVKGREGAQLIADLRSECIRLRDALLVCARKAEALKRDCGMEPDSPQALRNAQYQDISTTAHIALGTIGGPAEKPDLDPLQQAARLAGAGGWDAACAFAERHIPALARHMDTWGPNCGAPRDVYLGHLVRMLLDASGLGGL